MAYATYKPVAKVPNQPGKYYNNEGYVLMWVGKGKFELEHRVIAEKVLGRRLRPREVVHHIDGVRSNNSKSNLLICEASYHRELHHRCKRRYGRWHLPGIRDPHAESLRVLRQAPKLSSPNVAQSMYPPREASDTVASRSASSTKPTGSVLARRRSFSIAEILRKHGQ